MYLFTGGFWSGGFYPGTHFAVWDTWRHKNGDGKHLKNPQLPSCHALLLYALYAFYHPCVRHRGYKLHSFYALFSFPYLCETWEGKNFFNLHFPFLHSLLFLLFGDKIKITRSPEKLNKENSVGCTEKGKRWKENIRERRRETKTGTVL